MYADGPQSNDLNDFESRLATWQPAEGGLDADRLLYAAGRASVTRSKKRFAWPAATFVLAAMTAVLGMRLSVEHAERLALLNRPARAAASGEDTAIRRETAVVTEPLPADSLFAARIAFEKGIDAWQSAEPSAATEPTPPRQPIWQAWQSERMLER
jgi:hypothetical protein